MPLRRLLSKYHPSGPEKSSGKNRIISDRRPITTTKLANPYIVVSIISDTTPYRNRLLRPEYTRFHQFSRNV